METLITVCTFAIFSIVLIFTISLLYRAVTGKVNLLLRNNFILSGAMYLFFALMALILIYYSFFFNK